MKPTAHLHNDHRSRLLLALLTGLPLAIWLAPRTGALTALLAAWDIGIALYLVLLAILIHRADDSTSRQRLSQHPHGFSLLVWIVVTAMLSLICAGLIMNIHGRDGHHVVLLCAIAIVLAWLMMHAAFGRYYGQIHHELQQQVSDGGLRFAGEDPPRLIDFYYLSFMVALSYTSGDVVITHHRQRRVLLLQALVAFIFYSTVVTSVLSALFFLPGHARL